MKSGHEYSITLIRLNLPPWNHAKSLTLSISTTSFEIFIQNQRQVKNEKVNFFRQHLFIPSAKSDIIFRIYSTDSSFRKRLLETIPVKFDQLSSIKKRPALFHSRNEDFELVWEGKIFNGESSSEEEETNRDYTQFQNENDEATVELNPHEKKRKQSNAFINRMAPLPLCKRSTSAGSSYIQVVSPSQNQYDLKCSSKKQAKDDSFSSQNKNKRCSDTRSTTKEAFKKLFSLFNTGLTGMFTISSSAIKEGFVRT